MRSGATVTTGRSSAVTVKSVTEPVKEEPAPTTSRAKTENWLRYEVSNAGLMGNLENS